MKCESQGYPRPDTANYQNFGPWKVDPYKNKMRNQGPITQSYS